MIQDEDDILEPSCDAEQDNECGCNCVEDCSCGDQCNCGEQCNCAEGCGCGEDCDCHENCTCDDECDHECHCEENREYLKDLLRLQAEFDNYRKRMRSALGDARQDGFIDAIEQFLPAIDSFKMATDMITDKNTLIGIKYIEKGILDTLAKMGVEEIDTTGKFDPTYHQAVDADDSPEYESNDIIRVVAKGFMYKGRVIRYSQVIVKR